MAEKTVNVTSNTPNSSIEMSSADEKSHAHADHAEQIVRVERKLGLRIDGDDLDHEHEPKVCQLSHCGLVLPPHTDTAIQDDSQAIHESDGYGSSVDWQSDSCLSIW